MASKRLAGTPPLRRARSAADERIVARLRKLCLAMPEAVEKLSHGEPTWFAGKGKVFAMLDDHHHGAEHLSVWLPLPFGAQEALLARDPQRYFRPAYVGASGWVGVVLDPEPDWEAVERLLREAYLQVAARKLAARLQGEAVPAGTLQRTAGVPARAVSRRSSS